MAETQRAAGFATVSLYLVDRARSRLTLRESAGAPPAIQECPLADGRLPTNPLQHIYAQQGFAHVLAVPVAGREQELGFLVVAVRVSAELPSDDASLLQALAGLIGVESTLHQEET